MALDSSYLAGSLYEDSQSLFERWKAHLEFGYDFVKVCGHRSEGSTNAL